MRVARWVAAAVVLGGFALTPAGAGASLRAQQSPDISGEVDGLFPGSTATLEAEVTNPEALTINVTSVGATVGDANPACPGTLLTIDDSANAVDLPPGATATIPLLVHMDRAAPEACQGATFPLEFTATVGVVAGADVAAEAAEGAGSAPSSLAFTGTTVATLVGLALALLGVGVAIRRGARRHTARIAP